MAIRAFPPLRAAGAKPFRIRVRNNSSGESVTGAERVSASLADVWTWSLDARDMTGPEHERVTGFVAALQGRLNRVRVPIRRRPGTGPRARTGLAAAAMETFDDGSRFDDGSGFAPPELFALAASSAAAWSSRLFLSWPSGIAAPAPGDVFGIGAERAVMVTDVFATGATVEIAVWPPLRATLAAADTVLIEGGYVIMRSSTDDIGDEPFGSMFERLVSFKFVENLD